MFLPGIVCDIFQSLIEGGAAVCLLEMESLGDISFLRGYADIVIVPELCLPILQADDPCVLSAGYSHFGKCLRVESHPFFFHKAADLACPYIVLGENAVADRDFLCVGGAADADENLPDAVRAVFPPFRKCIGGGKFFRAYTFEMPAQTVMDIAGGFGVKVQIFLVVDSALAGGGQPDFFRGTLLCQVNDSVVLQCRSAAGSLETV